MLTAARSQKYRLPPAPSAPALPARVPLCAARAQACVRVARSDRSSKHAAKSFLGLSKSFKSRHEDDADKHWTQMEDEGNAAFGVNPKVEGRITNLAAE